MADLNDASWPAIAKRMETKPFVRVWKAKLCPIQKTVNGTNVVEIAGA